MGTMKTKAFVLTLALCFWGGALCFGADPQMGTWKLNEAKSKFTPGVTKNTMVVYEAAGDQVKVTSNGVDAKGKSTRSRWTGRFDGKNYPVTGGPNSDARSYKKIDDHTLAFTNWNHGRVTGTGQTVVSADGKSRTVTSSGDNRKGQGLQEHRGLRQAVGPADQRSVVSCYDLTSAAGFRLRDVTLYLLDVGAINGAHQSAPAIVDANLRD